MGKDAKYIVRLEAAERQQLQALVDEGRGSKSARQRARILLKADQAEGAPVWTEERVAEFAEVSLSTVHRVRQQFVTEGIESALRRRPSPPATVSKTRRRGRGKTDCYRLQPNTCRTQSLDAASSGRQTG